MALYFNGNKIIGSDGTCSADKVSLDDTNLSYEADDVQEAFEKVTKSLTYDEYEALTDAEKNNGTIYLITDVNGDGQSFQPVIYSEEEREIGVWTDGKPLYEKTLNLNVTNSGDRFDISNLHIDTMVQMVGFIHQTGGNNPSVPYSSSPNDYALPYYSFSDDSIHAIYAGSYNQTTWVITIRYTKTTDTAGSGTWTPQGIPAVHYSTDEQIVGTWIDGSTVYEKTVVSTSELTRGTTNQIELGTTNVKDFVSVEGFASYGSNNSYIPLPYGDRANSNICITTITKSGTANIYIGTDYTSPSTVNLVIITIRYTKSST